MQTLFSGPRLQHSGEKKVTIEFGHEIRKCFQARHSLDTSYHRLRDSFRRIPELSDQLAAPSLSESNNNLARAEAGLLDRLEENAVIPRPSEGDRE